MLDFLVRRIPLFLLALALVRMAIPSIANSATTGPIASSSNAADVDSLYRAIQGQGTGETSIIQIVGAYRDDPSGLRLLETRFRLKYGDLVGHLRRELNARDYKRVMSTLAPVLGDVEFVDAGQQAVDILRPAVLESEKMLAAALSAIETGTDSWTPGLRDEFSAIFDPGGTGAIDKAFERDAARNLQRILALYHEGRLVIVYVGNSGNCKGRRLFYTDMQRVYACAYIFSEQNQLRLARQLTHEAAHIALLVLDRPYYYPHDSRYLALTPRGPGAAQLPVVGPLIRELARSDTLYHPDAYAFFAAAAWQAAAGKLPE